MTVSPLRYPGGKARLAPMIVEEMRKHGITTLVEPFAGGLGVSLYAASKGYTCFAYDACPLVSAFWHDVRDDAEALVKRYREEPVTVENWLKHREKVSVDPDGLSVLFLNRTSVNGVLSGSGPIGGYEQKGAYKIDSRAYKDSVCKRLIEAHEELWDGRLYFWESNAMEVIGRESSDSFLYLDPPYVGAGSRLYPHQFDAHAEMRDALRVTPAKWMLSYDDHGLVRELYAGPDFKISEIPVEYASRGRTTKTELIITRSENQ